MERTQAHYHADAAADAAAIDKLAQDALAKNPDLPGMWIGIWDPAKGFYVQAYGQAVKGGAKATIADHGRIGSVTKTFTVVAVLEQVAAGKLKLESTIEEILPDLAASTPRSRASLSINSRGCAAASRTMPTRAS